MAPPDPDLQRTQALIRELGEQLKAATHPEGLGFVLVLFTYAPGFVTYVSSVSRDDGMRTLESVAGPVAPRKTEA